MNLETHQDISSGISGMKITEPKEGGYLFTREKKDISHLEGAEKFNYPMQDYFRMADDMSKVFVIILALKYGLFDCIIECGDSCTADDLLGKLNFKTSRRHLIDFLDQLYVHGLLERDGLLEQARYRLTDYTNKYLLKSSPSHFNYIFLNLDRYLRKYMTMDKTFSGGKTTHLYDDAYTNEEDLKCYLEYFYKSNEFNFDFLLKEFNFDNYEKVIDLHGLTGCLAMKIKQNFSKCQIIAFEHKNLKNCMETKLKGFNMQESIKTYFGDLRSDKLNADLLMNADCILAPHILMHFDCEKRKTILTNIFNCLKINGTLIIMENLIDENRSKDSCGLKISFMSIIMGYEGYASSMEEYRTLLTEIGFDEIKNISRHHGLSDFIVCRKLRDRDSATK
jgi:hypothetical protein